MTNEFKKLTKQNETRYILEMTSGGTGSAAVASNGATPTNNIGELHRRLQELKDKITVPVTQKPRQGPLKPQTGAGAHRDKKKEQKQGVEKHKKPFYEDSTNLDEFSQEPSDGGSEQPRFIRQDNVPSTDGKYMVQVWDDTESYSVAVAFVQRKGPQQYIMYPVDNPELEGEGGLLDRAQEYVDEIEENAIEGSKEDFIANKYMPLEAVLSNSFNEQVGEDHEVSMASSELTSIAKDAANLLDIVRQRSEEEGLEAWQQSKITKAADYMNSVLQSISGDEEQGVAESSGDKVHLKTPKHGLADHPDRNNGVGLRTFAQTPEQDRCPKCNSLFKNHYKQGVAEGDWGWDDPQYERPKHERNPDWDREHEQGMDKPKPNLRPSQDVIDAEKKAAQIRQAELQRAMQSLERSRQPFPSLKKKDISEKYDEWDEADMWYRFDHESGTLKQKSWVHARSREARANGWRESHDAALRDVGIIRSKFKPGKFVQKVGGKWVEVFPYGKPNDTKLDPNKDQDVGEGVAGPKNCWPGYRKVGTQPGTGKNAGKPVNDCEKIKKEDVYLNLLNNKLSKLI